MADPPHLPDLERDQDFVGLPILTKAMQGCWATNILPRTTVEECLSEVQGEVVKFYSPTKRDGWWANDRSLFANPANVSPGMPVEGVITFLFWFTHTP